MDLLLIDDFDRDGSLTCIDDEVSLLLLLRLGVYFGLLSNELVKIGLVALSKALRSADRRYVGDG